MATPQLPDYIDRNDRSGFLEDDRDVVRPPRLTLMQAMSDKVSSRLAMPGDFWSEAQGKVLQVPITFIPLAEGKEWLEFDDQFQLLWKASSAEEAIEKGGPDAPWKSLTVNLLILVDGYVEIISFRASALRALREFHAKAKALGGPLYGQAWHLFSKQVSGKTEKNKYYVPIIEFKDFLDRGRYEIAKERFNEFKDSFARQLTTQAEPTTPLLAAPAEEAPPPEPRSAAVPQLPTFKERLAAKAQPVSDPDELPF